MLNLWNNKFCIISALSYVTSPTSQYTFFGSWTQIIHPVK